MNRFIHRHPISVSIAAASVLILVVGVLGLGASPAAILAGLLCLGMMGSMLWMMVAMAAGHGHQSGDSPHDR